jgi:hypothetical protein
VLPLSAYSERDWQRFLICQSSALIRQKDFETPGGKNHCEISHFLSKLAEPFELKHPWMTRKLSNIPPSCFILKLLKLASCKPPGAGGSAMGKLVPV